jgi:hypothetical protein
MDKLFVSRVRIKLLHYFLSNQDVPVHLRGAVRELDEEINAVRRELNRMEEVKLLKSDHRGNRKYFILNKQGPFVEELTGIVYKTFGLGGEIVRNQTKLGDVKFAILTTSYTSGVSSNAQNVDLVLIGDINMEELQLLIDNVERKENREINYTVLKYSDFELRKRRRDSFVMDMLISTKILVIGTQEDLIA